LDSGHIKDFLAVLGLGITSQALEGVMRNLVGNLFQRLAGSFLGNVASGATGPVFTFASTYAMGRLAEQYYAGGRQLSVEQLKETFQNLLTEAQTKGAQLLPEIQTRARTLNLSDLPGLIRGLI